MSNLLIALAAVAALGPLAAAGRSREALAISYELGDGLQPFSEIETDPGDHDGDGIPEIRELQLAQAFFPRLWYSREETCPGPGGTKAVNLYPGRLVYAVSRWDQAAAYGAPPGSLIIRYVTLYNRDCGLNSHQGDAEAFLVTVRPQSGCPLGYGFNSISTAAHRGEGSFKNTLFGDGECDIRRGALDVFVSAKKHGLFLSKDRCNHSMAGPLHLDRCDAGYTLGGIGPDGFERNSWLGMNAGEGDPVVVPLENDLSALGFPFDDIWDKDTFCGGSLGTDCGGSSPSKVLKSAGTTPEDPLPIQPEGPSMKEPVGAGEILTKLDPPANWVLGWKPVVRATTYWVEVEPQFCFGDDCPTLGEYWPGPFYAAFTLPPGAYRFNILARNQAGGSPLVTGYSGLVPEPPCATPPLEKPVPRKPTGSTSMPVTFRWVPSACSRSFDLEVRLEEAPDPIVQQNVVGAELQVDDPFDCDTSHTWRVRGVNDHGVGPWSDPVAFTPSCEVLPPAAATKVVATPVVGGGDLVDLRWQDNSDNEQGFRIERLRSGDPYPSTVADLDPDVTSYRDRVPVLPVQPNATEFYFYRVIAYNTGGSTPSERVEARLYNLDPWEAPSVLHPRGCIDSVVPELTWQGVQYASQYYVRVLDALTGTPVMPDMTPTDTHVVVSAPLQPEHAYMFRVRGMNNLGPGGPWSDLQNFMPSCQPLSIPVLVGPQGCVDSPTPTLTWAPVTGAAFYVAYVWRVAGDPSADVLITSQGGESGWPVLQGTSLTLTPDVLTEPLVAGQEYRFEVKAHNGGAPGPKSGSLYFTPRCTSSQGPGTATLVSPAGTIQSGTPTYYWKAASLADSYQLQLRQHAGPILSETEHAGPTVCAGLDCSATPSMALPAGDYDWYVRARNATSSNWGPYSIGARFTVPVLPLLSVGDATVLEGTGGDTTALVPLVLSAPASAVVEVHLDLPGETATPGSDYSGQPLIARFPVGATQAMVGVSVVSDGTHEAPETFLARVVSVQGAAVLREGRVTIQDDDPVPQLVMGDAANPEHGPEGGAEWRVPVHLLGQSDQEVTATVTFGACTAQPDSDFAPDAQVVTFAPGETEKSVTLQVFDDSSPEGHEVVMASLSNAEGAVIAENPGQVTIIDDDVTGLRKRAKRSDFDGDGNNDLVWQDPSTGALSLWRMVGVNRLETVPFVPAVPEGGTGWKLVGVAYFNADGKPDLLWRDDASGKLAFWFMNGVTRVGVQLVDGEPDLAWKVVATGNFNGDASADLLWRDDATGNLKVWFMNGTARQGEAALTPSHAAADNWYVRGVGDLDGDGKDDLLWRNPTVDRLVAWLMDGVVRREARVFEPDGLLSWRVAALMDMDADGTTDIVWQHDDPDRVAAWLMSGTTLRCPTFLTPRAPDAPGRSVVGPR
jgi:hypothetical protein